MELMPAFEADWAPRPEARAATSMDAATNLFGRINEIPQKK
jgi:hypothetical protein